MCQPGSRGLNARSEKSVPVNAIYPGDRDRLGGVGGRPSLRPAPAAAPRIDETKAVAAISGPTASNVTRALTGAPAPMAPAAPQAQAPTATRRIVSSPPVIRPVATATKVSPADFQASVRGHVSAIQDELAASAASAPTMTKPVPAVSAQPSNAVMLPSGVEFRGNDVQKQLVREFLKIAKQVADLPTGVEHKDARKAARTSLCYQIQKLLGMRFVDVDKRRFAQTVSAELKSKLPTGTDLSQILPVFIQEWAAGKNM